MPWLDHGIHYRGLRLPLRLREANVAEISVRLSREGGKKADASKALKGRKPDPSEVSGQETYITIVCWNCWALNEVVDPGPGKPLNFICWNCGIGGVI
jgi:hypothetical protein